MITNHPMAAVLVCMSIFWLLGFMFAREFYIRKVRRLERSNATLRLIGSGLMRDDERRRRSTPSIDHTAYPFWLGHLRQHQRRDLN